MSKTTRQQARRPARKPAHAAFSCNARTYKRTQIKVQIKRLCIYPYPSGIGLSTRKASGTACRLSLRYTRRESTTTRANRSTEDEQWPHTLGIVAFGPLSTLAAATHALPPATCKPVTPTGNAPPTIGATSFTSDSVHPRVPKKSANFESEFNDQGLNDFPRFCERHCDIQNTQLIVLVNARSRAHCLHCTH